MTGFLQNFLIYWNLNIFKYFSHQSFCQLLLSLQWQVPFSVLTSVGPNMNRLMWHSSDLVFPKHPHIPRCFHLLTETFFLFCHGFFAILNAAANISQVRCPIALPLLVLSHQQLPIFQLIRNSLLKYFLSFPQLSACLLFFIRRLSAHSFS